MKSAILVAAVIFFALASAGDVIWKPKQTVQQNVALIVIQGAQITPEQYAPLVDVLQDVSQFSLWVGIPDYISLHIPEPLEIGSGIDRILKAMNSQGMKGSVPVFFAGHALGGVILQEYLQNHSTTAKGQILWGSYLLEKYRNTTYRVPTLTIGGELDGLTRVTRIMEAYYHQILNAANQSTALMNFPVIVVNGMTHFQYASGSPPLLVKLHDLKPEISYMDAHRKVATYTTAFMSLHTGDSSILQEIESAVHRSGEFLQPLIAAYTQEGFYQFKPPCYDNPPSPSCTYGCPWTEYAQTIMGGLTKAKLLDKDAFHPVYQTNPVHFPHILNNCSKPDNCILLTVTVTQNIYDVGDNLDTAFLATSASEIKAKLKSRQSILEAVGYANVDFNTSDGSSICRVINQESYEWAKRNAGNKTLARFERVGVPIVMGEDKGPYNAGPLWIWTPLSLSKKTNSSGGAVLEVRAPMMRTPTDYFIKAFAGVHYCKLLSPARTTEWIYVDGLREYYSINNTTTSH